MARAAQAACGLSEVLFCPVGWQPLKPAGSTASFEQRVAMTQLAIAGDPSFRISLADAPRTDGQPNYTWHTLTALRQECAADDRLFLLIGADSLASFRRWWRAAELPFLATLIVAARKTDALDDMAALLPAEVAATYAETQAGVGRYALTHTDGRQAEMFVLTEFADEAASTAIRAGGGQSEALDPAVSNYIRTHQLYTSLAAPR